ncbi:hypothetical protein Q5427_11320 [Brochothrix thermosphacta]|uniref:hypothetical protein n=1 Tax=Brochothrix thermosphacta TaxID=2756 RepID=UPI0027141CD2|nr:hypothetical protein [Brochothrix thermosphacta]MDO7864880.1 hypothetical protein [Brochothrix thermosphacta]
MAKTKTIIKRSFSEEGVFDPSTNTIQGIKDPNTVTDLEEVLNALSEDGNKIIKISITQTDEFEGLASETEGAQ